MQAQRIRITANDLLIQHETMGLYAIRHWSWSHQALQQIKKGVLQTLGNQYIQSYTMHLLYTDVPWTRIDILRCGISKIMQTLKTIWFFSGGGGKMTWVIFAAHVDFEEFSWNRKNRPDSTRAGVSVFNYALSWHIPVYDSISWRLQCLRYPHFFDIFLLYAF